MAEIRIPIIRPTLPGPGELDAELREILASGMVTNGERVRAIERAAAVYAGVSEAVAFSSCTSALILAIKGLDLAGEIIVPSFTFAASAHAIVLAGCEPVFCDCLPGSFTMDPESARAAVSPRTSALMPVYCFGVPPEMDELEALARERSLAVITDAAQGWGSTYRERRAGSMGKVECFSMSPTKVVTAMEGGMALTRDRSLAERLRRLRDYGKAADGEDMEWIGLSARMSEIHAAVGRWAVERTDELVSRRRELIAEYVRRLGGLAGVSFQRVPAHSETSGNYMVVLLDGARARLDRDGLYAKLKERGIQTKRYFYPPVHRQTAYRGVGRVSGELRVTGETSARSLALPLYTHMKPDVLEEVARAVTELLG